MNVLGLPGSQSLLPFNFNKLKRLNDISVATPTSASPLNIYHSSYSGWRPTGRLVTTLYEHQKPVTGIAVTDDSQYFLTASKKDCMVHVWATPDIEKDVTSHSVFSVVANSPVNSITTIDNSTYFATACQNGTLDIYSMERVSSDSQVKGGGFFSNSPYADSKFDTQQLNFTSIVKSIKKDNEGELLKCKSMLLPTSHEHLLAYASQKCSFFLHDLRARYDAI